LGEELIINLLRIILPDEIFLATSPFGGGRDAIPELMKYDDPRFDWVIRRRRFVSFFDPREHSTRAIVDLDQVEAVDATLFAFNDDLDDANDMIDLLRRTVERQTSSQLSYLRKERLFHFRASAIRKSRSYRYFSSVNETSAKVVSAYVNKKNPKGQGYVRHHAARLRFDALATNGSQLSTRTFTSPRMDFNLIGSRRRFLQERSASNVTPLFAVRCLCGNTCLLKAVSARKGYSIQMCRSQSCNLRGYQ
jgi:hypothetical protein